MSRIKSRDTKPEVRLRLAFVVLCLLEIRALIWPNMERLHHLVRK